MDEKQRCQSCGMPVSPGFFGTEINGVQNILYCKFCYTDGSFTNPLLTMNEMIDLSIENMTKDLKFPREKAETLANSVIPSLKRWKTSITS